jgi:hypothetical protein
MMLSALRKLLSPPQPRYADGQFAPSPKTLAEREAKARMTAALRGAVANDKLRKVRNELIRRQCCDAIEAALFPSVSAQEEKL